jgi:hypothetical protein
VQCDLDRALASQGVHLIRVWRIQMHLMVQMHCFILVCYSFVIFLLFLLLFIVGDWHELVEVIHYLFLVEIPEIWLFVLICLTFYVIVDFHLLLDQATWRLMGKLSDRARISMIDQPCAWTNILLNFAGTCPRWHL